MQLPQYELEKIHDHDSRIKMIEQRCAMHSDTYKEIKDALENIQKSIVDIKIENASRDGVRSALFGGGGGSLIVAGVELVKHFMNK
jgi:hypothetical protein